MCSVFLVLGNDNIKEMCYLFQEFQFLQVGFSITRQMNDMVQDQMELENHFY